MPENTIEWEFQVEQQNFIARYGKGGGLFWKQVILQPGVQIPNYPVKRITQRAYETAQRIVTLIE